MFFARHPTLPFIHMVAYVKPGERLNLKAYPFQHTETFLSLFPVFVTTLYL